MVIKISQSFREPSGLSHHLRQSVQVISPRLLPFNLDLPFDEISSVCHQFFVFPALISILQSSIQDHILLIMFSWLI